MVGPGLTGVEVGFRTTHKPRSSGTSPLPPRARKNTWARGADFKTKEEPKHEKEKAVLVSIVRNEAGKDHGMVRSGTYKPGLGTGPDGHVPRSLLLPKGTVGSKGTNDRKNSHCALSLQVTVPAKLLLSYCGLLFLLSCSDMGLDI